MQPKTFVLVFVLLLLGLNTLAQTGYIYVHLKHINEEAGPDYSFTVYNSSGASVATFTLNDKATSDNVALSGNYLHIYDIGESHGTGGDGELWTVCGTNWNYLQSSTTLTDVSGTIYYRAAGSSSWVNTGITGARNIDGAYQDQCVYTTTAGRVVFYNAATNTSKTIYTGSDAWDVTANGGTIALCTTGGTIKVLTTTYSATSAPSGTTWNTVYTASSRSQLDMSLDGGTIALFTRNSIVPATLTAKKSGTASPVNLASLGSTVATASTPWDIAYDDSGYVYVSAGNSATGLTGIYSYDGSGWTYESRSGDVTGVTAGAGRSVFGVQTQLTDPADETIFTRIQDKPTATTYWIDDERVKSSASLYGNGIMLAVTPGTYTVIESVPDGYDLGRFNVYDPQGQSSGSVSDNTFTAVVADDEVVFGEFINEKLNAKPIALSCVFQYLQTFDANNSSPIYTYTFGTGTYGSNVEGTAYHYWDQENAHDGYYYVVKNTSNWFNNTGLSDHTGNNGYFMLINASFQADEFYRQRVTNLVPGLQYTISFYAANVSPDATTLEPNITFGLQDTLGNNVNTATSGDITQSNWQLYTFSFTATTSTADLYMTNNGIGGNGNDLAIDDIAINPVITPLPDIQVSPKIAPNVCIGTSYHFSNNQSGGIWTSSSTDVATINPKTGITQGLAAGTAVITYTYTNQVGCISVKNTGIIVSAPPSSISVSSLDEGLVCNGQVDSLFAQANGGTAPITYSWAGYPGSSQHGLSAADSVKQNAQVMPTTLVDTSYSYIALATDSVGCTISDTVTIAVSGKTAPNLSVTSSNTCLNSSVNLAASLSGGDISSPTYTWTTTGGAAAGLSDANMSTAKANPTAAGTYTYKIKAFSGYCNVVKTTTVTAYPNPSLSVSGPSGSQGLCSNGTIALASNLNSGGTLPDSYAWTGSFVSGPTSSPDPGLQSPTTGPSAAAAPKVTSTSSTNTDIYRYMLTVTDANGCAAKDSVDVQVYAGSGTSFTATASSSPAAPVTLCSGASISLSSSSSFTLGTKSYSWTGPGGFTSTAQNPAATAAATGNYVVTITDGGLLGSGCTASAVTGLFTVNPSPSVTATNSAATICTNTPDTIFAAATSGTLPYSYAWTSSPAGVTVDNPSDSSSTITVSTYGKTYTFTMIVTDDNGCTATGQTTITALNQSGPTISGMAAAASVCAGTTLSFNPTITPGGSITTLTPDGEGASSQSGGSHHANQVDDNDPSTYWRSSNSNGEWVYLDFGSAVAVSSITFYPASGAESNMRRARIDISDNSNFNSYSTIYTFSNTAPDAGYTTIPSSALSGVTAKRYLRVYFGSHRGYLAELSATTGSTTPVSTYLWSASPSAGSGINSASSQNTTASPSSGNSYTYTLKATDDDGCTATASTGLQTVYDSVTVTALSSNPGFCGTTGSIQLFATPTGGSGNYSTYTWTYTTNIGTGTSTFSSASDQNPTVTLDGVNIGDKFTYNVSVTDDAGCNGSDSTNTIVVANTPSVAASASAAGTRCVGQSINLHGIVTGPTTSTYSFAWTPPSNSVVSPSSVEDTVATQLYATATTAASGNYAYGLLVVDSNNCTASANTSPVIFINDTPKVSISTGAIPSLLCANPSSAITLNGSITTGTTGHYTYSWLGSGVNNLNATTTTANPVTSGAFAFTVTDDSSCTGTAYTPVVTVDEATPSISVAGCGVNGNGFAWVQLYESNGTDWLWTAGLGISRFYSTAELSDFDDATTSASQSPFVKIKDIYTVAITKANGCKGSGSIDATVALGGCAVLSTDILSFTVQKQYTSALLQWDMPGNATARFFDVERSGDGRTWQAVGKVQAVNNNGLRNNYSFTDKEPLNGTNYYRLKQVNINGSYGYSAVRSIEFSSFWAVKQYPNPVSDYLVLEFNTDKEEKAFIKIQTASGATVYTKEFTPLKGFNRLVIPQLQQLAQGMYIVTLADKSNLYHAKFVKGNTR